MEEVKSFQLEDLVNAFTEAGKSFAEVKVFHTDEKAQDEKCTPIKVIDGTQVMKFFENFIDEDTKNLVNKFSNAENTAEKIELVRQYHQKFKDEQQNKVDKGKGENTEERNLEEEKNTEEKAEEQREIKVERRVSNVNDLVQRERDLNSRIAALCPADRKEYYAKLYQIPTDKDLHLKLDAILERLEDLSSEVAIMRRHLYTK